MRWGQTNITERDPIRYDIDWWRDYWKQTSIQGVIINAGGIVAYYPSRFPLQHRAEFLNGRDLYGELVEAARREKLSVIARMDSNRASEEFLRAHPDWFARNSAGEPYRDQDKFISCINSGYYREYLPEVLKEIIERTHPDGFADNSWAGLRRSSICYCNNCSRQFQDKHGHKLPANKNWDDPVYREWIEWGYQCRLDLWDLNNQVTKSAGGPNCLWMGMNSGSVTDEASSFRDLRAICLRSEMLLLDHQSRTESTGFSQNVEAGMLVHSLLGGEKLVPESMALYQAPSRPGQISFRLASKPADEARMWMYAAMAGGIQPWWHHVGAYHEDRRMYHTAQPVFAWHKANEQYLVDRQSVASVGVVWSQRNTDFFGRDQAAIRVDLPWNGFVQALIRARILHMPIHIDDVPKASGSIKALVLPNIGALSDNQCALLREFVRKGGCLIATGATSLYDEWGAARSDFGLADLFGVHTSGAEKPAAQQDLGNQVQSYLRLMPQNRGQVWGPKEKGEPASDVPRHRVLLGFDQTDLIPFGATLTNLKVDAGTIVPLTYVPPFPAFPPETAWMREPQTDIPGLILRQKEESRIAFLPAPLDSCYARDNLPDHADLLAHLVSWAISDQLPLRVEGPGLLDCRLYRQREALILHILNLSNEAAWKAPVNQLIPVGPINIDVELPTGVQGTSVQALVSSVTIHGNASAGRLRFTLPIVKDHEVLVIN